MPAEGRYYAERGYVVVANDVRGRYASEGTWRLIADDPEDGYDVVEWIARQDWSDGKVGTFGTSYPGGTQHALAEMNPPHLTTMVPIDAVSNCGVSGMRHGGAFELRFMNWIFQTGAPNSKAALADPALRRPLRERPADPRARRQPADPPGHHAAEVVPEYESWLVEAMRSGPESPFWHNKGMSVVDHVADYADVPVLHITGWYDSWTRQVTMNYEALSKAKKSPQRLVIGPWVHGGQNSNVAGEVEFTREAGIDLLAFRLRWYDRWLKGEKNGVDDDPPVLLYIMGTGDDRRSPPDGSSTAASGGAEREWPLARVAPTTSLPARRRHASRKPPAARPTPHDLHLRPATPRADHRRQHLVEPGADGQRRLRPAAPRRHPRRRNRLPLSERRDVLVFRPSPARADLEVTGTVLVKLWVSSTAPDTDFTAKLIDEIPPNPDYPLGFDLNLGDSIFRARYREGLDHQAAPLDPGDIADHDHALSDRQCLQERAPHPRRRLEQQLSPVRREPQHRRPAGRLPPHGPGRQHDPPRRRPPVAGRYCPVDSRGDRQSQLRTERQLYVKSCRSLSMNPPPRIVRRRRGSTRR